MVAFITVAEGRRWSSPRWVFYNLIEDAQVLAAKDPDLVDALQTCWAMDGIKFSLKPAQLAGRIAECLLETISATLDPDDGRLNWRTKLDDDGRRRYLASIQDLRPYLEEAARSYGTPGSS